VPCHSETDTCTYNVPGTSDHDTWGWVGSRSVWEQWDRTTSQLYTSQARASRDYHTDLSSHAHVIWRGSLRCQVRCICSMRCNALNRRCVCMWEHWGRDWACVKSTTPAGTNLTLSHSFKQRPGIVVECPKETALEIGGRRGECRSEQSQSAERSQEMLGIARWLFVTALSRGNSEVLLCLYL
jgi:hypothetical protein